MKIINPFNLVMWLIIYVVTACYLRMAPTIGNSRVGWCSEEGDHAVCYDPRNGHIFIASIRPDGVAFAGRAIPDGRLRTWLNTVTMYRTLLHKVVGEYLEYTYDVEVDDD